MTKDWQYRRKKLDLARKNISLYSSGHTMAERLDKAQVPQRLRDRLMGHAPTGAKARFGMKRPANAELAVVLQNLVTPLVQKLCAILVPPYERALAGEMSLPKPWLKQRERPNFPTLA